MFQYNSVVSEKTEEKAIGQFRLQLNGVFTPFRVYGLDVFIPGAVDETIQLALQLHERLNGKDVPILYQKGGVTRNKHNSS